MSDDTRFGNMLFEISIVIFFISACFGAIAVGLYVYCKFTMGKCGNSIGLSNKTILITGGNSGVGLEAVREFARRGARLILACRDVKKAREAIRDIQQQTGNIDIEVHEVDISSLASVEELVRQLTLSLKKIDVLCLHAGTGPVDSRQETSEGHEKTFATNHLGHFHLVQLLRPALNPGSRIIITTSMAHEYVRLDFENLQQHKAYNGVLCYARSKLMNVYFMRELAQRLLKDGITVNAQNPGLVHTSGLKNSSALGNWLSETLVAPVYAKTSWQGAQTLIHLATSDELDEVTGCLFRDCKPTRLNEIANDKRAPKKLWQYSEQLIRNTSRSETTP
ncbi:retinol dehydrogenase 12-like [Galendromus occidentalis]|uniref:Retinol dehydrogenase 12-like n=1 Tax=Galendromus occidentalis TaxID=34638 RepID=A0AAJ7WH83_9ACAR|nr:retinol dehydrogenase 12-like [Galendromus occidentalis]